MIHCEGYLLFITDDDGIYLRCQDVWLEGRGKIKIPDFIIAQYNTI